MLGTMGKKGKIQKERNNHMEKILSEILNELKDFHEEMRDIKSDVREVKQEVRDFKEENRKEHEQMRKEIKEETDFIIETTRSIERIVGEIRQEQRKQERHLILIKNVNLEKNKSQDAILALHQTRIEKCEKKLAEILN